MDLSKVLEKELLEGRFWTHSMTLVSGCTKVSPGCLNCWSEAMQMRFNGGKAFDGTIVEHPERCNEILPKSEHRKPRVWTYWNDVFHEGVSEKLHHKLFARLDVSRNDYHIICTKRPERAVEYFRLFPGNTKNDANLIILVTMEDQERFQDRLPHAIDLAQLGFDVGLLCEPMLSPIRTHSQTMNGDWLKFFKWVICGPENGKGKRPFDGQWAMSLQAAAKAAGIPFFYKAGLLNGKRYIETP